MHAPILRKFFPATQNDGLNAANKAFMHNDLSAKCNAIFSTILQADSNGARALNRATRVRYAMAAKAKVRTALIAHAILRIKCAKLWGVINPASLLTKQNILHNSNSEAVDGESTRPLTNHVKIGEEHSDATSSATATNSNATVATRIDDSNTNTESALAQQQTSTPAQGRQRRGIS